jgi:hypothetical protein
MPCPHDQFDPLIPKRHAVGPGEPAQMSGGPVERLPAH